MIPVRRFLLACAGSLLLVPMAAAAQSEGQTETSDRSETAAPESGSDTPKDGAAEEKRICRYVKLDMSSRRKTKVCRTVEEWRELNNPR